jgi:hypothetical protein
MRAAEALAERQESLGQSGRTPSPGAKPAIRRTANSKHNSGANIHPVHFEDEHLCTETLANIVMG